MQGLEAREPELQKGGRYYKRPLEYALAKFMYFECSKCHKPYCVCVCEGGGERAGCRGGIT